MRGSQPYTGLSAQAIIGFKVPNHCLQITSRLQHLIHDIDESDYGVVSEPGAIALLGLGMLTMGLRRRKA